MLVFLVMRGRIGVGAVLGRMPKDYQNEELLVTAVMVS
jgi:hypothetical protein